MVGRIVGLISCMMCAIPFLIIACNKDSIEPINFWSGDTTLKLKVKNVKEYNKEMALLYKKCAIAFVVTGAVFLVMPIVGVLMMCLECTVGFYLVHRKYKKILQLHSNL